jgi:hypothetical protein
MSIQQIYLDTCVVYLDNVELVITRAAIGARAPWWTDFEAFKF